MNKEYKRLLVEQLESSVDFLTHKRSQAAVDGDEGRKLLKELSEATAQLYNARAMEVTQ